MSILSENSITQTRLPKQAIAATLVGSLIITASAQVQLPLPLGVPVTLQTLAILGIAMIMGPSIGLSSVILYLAEAACGLPVLAGFKNGLLGFSGPTGGYLVGFIFTALIAGILAKNGFQKSRLKVFLAGGLALTPTYLIGLWWLQKFTVSWEVAYTSGVAPFLFGEVLKLFFLALLVPSACKLTKAASQKP